MFKAKPRAGPGPSSRGSSSANPARKRYRISIIGARGLANYGGFETYAKDLAPRLAAAGFRVSCACERAPDRPEYYRGARLLYFPFNAPRNYTLRKIFEVVYDIYFILKGRYDLVYGLGFHAGPFYLIPRILGKVSVVNIDGLDWEREKYSRFERQLLKIIYLFAAGMCSVIAIDNTRMEKYVPERWRNKVVYAPNGVNQLNSAEPLHPTSIQAPSPFRELVTSKKYQYWLAIARLEPENSIHLIVEAFAKSQSRRELVIIGDFTSAKYEAEIRRRVLELGGQSRILLTGALYNQETLDAVRASCYAYIHGHSKGGTNPSLLEIMRTGKLILALDTEFNREVGGNTLVYFENQSELTEQINRTEASLEEGGSSPYAEEVSRVAEYYSWERLTPGYIRLFDSFFDKRRRVVESHCVFPVPLDRRRRSSSGSR